MHKFARMKNHSPICALIWWSESEKISKGPKLNENSCFIQPLLCTSRGWSNNKTKVWRALQKEIPRLKERKARFCRVELSTIFIIQWCHQNIFTLKQDFIRASLGLFLPLALACNSLPPPSK